MTNHDTWKVKARRKWRLIKKDATTLAIQKRSRNIQLSLLADFLANRISAAGFSHVVKSPSPLRKKLWAVVIVIAAISMIVMTYRVLQEYLEYPTIIRSKHKVLLELEFPAVTICGMSSYTMMFAPEGYEDMFETMKAYLNDFSKYNISKKDRTRCLKDPLCNWIWSLDVCKCYENPCQSSYCYKNISEDKCQCSEDMCKWKGSADACYLDTDNNSMSKCTCSTNFTYPLANMDQESDPQDNTYPHDGILNLISLASSAYRDQEYFYNADMDPWRFVMKTNNGLPMDSIILWCSFAGSSCSDFETLYTALGKCYMFNYVGEEATKPKKVETVWLPRKQHDIIRNGTRYVIINTAGSLASESQKDYLYELFPEDPSKTHFDISHNCFNSSFSSDSITGLTLFMRSSSKDFLPFTPRQVGVRIFLHDPRSLPIVQEDGIDLRPGDMSAISMKYKEIHRLGSPWGKCAQDGQKVGVYCHDPYKQNDCEQKCFSAEIYGRCSCYASEFLRSATIPPGKPLCDDINDFGYCALRAMKFKSLKKMNCSCPPACREKLYPFSLSSSKLNEDYFKLVKELQSFRMVNGTPETSRSDFVSSMLGVQIFYNSMIVTHLNETPLYSWESLVSNIGGNMGLFLGISLITFLEAFEFLLDTIRNAFPTRKKLPSRISPAIISEIQNTEENPKT